MTKKAIAMRKRARKTRRRIMRRERKQRGGQMPEEGYSGKTVVTGKILSGDETAGELIDKVPTTHSE
jgi:hypothetical protein